MLVNKTTNPDEISKLADCELNIRQRETISADLGVKGPRTAPANIDMRAIIPVYDMNPQSRLLKIFEPSTNVFNLGGTNNFTAYVLPDNPWEKNSHTIWRNIDLYINTDNPGRAALAEAYVQVSFRLQIVSPVGLPMYSNVGRVRWLIDPNPNGQLLSLVYIAGDEDPLYGTEAEIMPHEQIEPVTRWRIPLNFRTDQNTRLILGISTTIANFPVPTTVQWGSLVEFY